MGKTELGNTIFKWPLYTRDLEQLRTLNFDLTAADGHDWFIVDEPVFDSFKGKDLVALFDLHHEGKINAR